MSTKQLVLAIILLAFGAQTAYVTLLHGSALFDLAFANPVTILLCVDLTIALGLIISWMIVDARERGSNPWAYVVLTLLTGSVGPLLYLIRRERGPATASAQPARA